MEGAEQTARLLLGYDDVDAIRYFDFTAKAYYARSGRTILQALHACWQDWDAIGARCGALDAQLLADARRVGGEAYATLVAAAYRQSIAAHKLIAEMCIRDRARCAPRCLRRGRLRRTA